MGLMSRNTGPAVFIAFFRMAVLVATVLEVAIFN